MSTYYSGVIPPSLYRLHPGFGARPSREGELISLDEADLPHEWRELPESVQDEIWEEWAAELLETVSVRGQSRVLVDLSDRVGLEELLSFPECSPGPRPGSLICEATARVIRALVVANPADLVQTLNSNAYLTVVESWDAVFLHVEDREILDRFGAPALQRRREGETG